MSVIDIRSAIRAELNATPEYYDFKVDQSARDGRLWRISVQPGAVFTDGGLARVVLDDSFDGAAAWWAGPPKGAADVLTVISEEDQIILRGATSVPPGPDEYIRLYPPRYLDALARGWTDGEWARRAYGCLKDLSEPVHVDVNPLSGHAFRWLRKAQRRALRLVNHSSAFLWGPPGTGKTTTLGVLLAEYLHLNPKARVLLLSTTNHAVDQALVSVDKALEQSGRAALRRVVKRVGTRFAAGHYLGREHLLPVVDRDLISKLANVESERPPSSDIEAYSAWSVRLDDVRAELRAQAIEVLRTSRLAAMTTTRAAFTLKDLRELPPYDLVVFDEASQVGLAQALLLMPLGKARLFAGDPKQLSPVVLSQERYAQRWLAKSPFSEMRSKAQSVCLLDEQSRMAQPISDLVSNVFYDGQLKVSADALASPDWQLERQVALRDYDKKQHVCLAMVAEEGCWSQHYRGPIRYASAVWVAKLLRDSIEAGFLEQHDVIVLTPFRAQRALLRKQLGSVGIRKIRVSTVHRAQGSEATVVVFDPVEARNDFLRTEEAARLLNVGISRAKAKLVMVLSPGDLDNPLFASIAHRDRLSSDDREPVSLKSLLMRPDFESSALYQRVSIGRHIGEVSRISSDGRTLYMRNEATGAEQAFDLDFWKQKMAGMGVD